ncbi:MAG TPA: pilus assembly protein N-terminal domain-containing protein [Candidatus Binataceae bacterium]|nr:pilus assembly protein N-terminal domain-containing protein [Candidatus Binataceae bacterium]
MQSKYLSAQLFSRSFPFIAALGLAIQLIAAGVVHAASTQAITLSAGETRVIDNLNPDAVPGVTVVSNPHAMLLHDEAPGKLVILGAESGQWKISVKRNDGQDVTYDVTVHSIEDWSKGPNPATAPAAPSVAESGAPALADASAAAVIGASVAAPPAVVASTSAVAIPVPPASAPVAAAPVAPPAVAPVAAPAPEVASGPTISAQNPGRLFHADPSIMTSGSGYSTDGVASTAGAHFLPADGISMMTGMSRVIDFPERLRRVSISATEIADIQVMSPYQLNLIAHKPGFATLAVWTGPNHYEERQVRVDPGGKQQVMLSCVVAQLDRGKTETQGVNLSLALQNAGLSLVGLPGQVATPYSPLIPVTSQTVFGPVNANQSAVMGPGGSLMPLLLSQNMTYGLATSNGQWNTQSFFQMLENHDLAKILARPDLLANSGERATFLSGGEIPIVIAQALNTSIQFKTYGTKVAFLPTVVGLDDIELLVEPEVSQLDYTHAVQLFGFTIPAFLTRRARTLVRLRDNQTLIIAGLNLSEKHEVIQKVPYIGDVPYLGGLFRNTTYENSETDLVMTVTPRIVRPLPSGADPYLPPLSRGGLTAAEVRTQRTGSSDAARPRF